MTIVETIPTRRDNPFGLGRHIEHDPMSRRFTFAKADLPIREKSWLRYGVVLDQGNVGACTGFASAHAMNMKPNYVSGEGTMKNEDGLDIYSAATVLDEFPGAWPPNDTGSSGLGACKALLSRNQITEYRWAFGFDQMLQALMHSPVMLGTNWYEQMFYPSSTGRLTIGGQVAGGHEFVISGVASLRDRMLWLQNSWGAGWGVKGRAVISFDDVTRLLNEAGDCVIPVGGQWT